MRRLCHSDVWCVLSWTHSRDSNCGMLYMEDTDRKILIAESPGNHRQPFHPMSGAQNELFNRSLFLTRNNQAAERNATFKTPPAVKHATV